MLVAVLPPGAFFGMALLLTVRNLLTAKRKPVADTGDGRGILEGRQ
jgi:hypothetical protein